MGVPDVLVNLPLGHTSQYEAPVVGWLDPAGQDWQEDEPGASLKVPLAQGEQSLLCCVNWYS